jgi:hypothetical protein
MYTMSMRYFMQQPLQLINKYATHLNIIYTHAIYFFNQFFLEYDNPFDIVIIFLQYFWDIIEGIIVKSIFLFSRI